MNKGKTKGLKPGVYIVKPAAKKAVGRKPLDLKTVELDVIGEQVFAALGGKDGKLEGAKEAGFSALIVLTRQHEDGEGIQAFSSTIGTPTDILLGTKRATDELKKRLGNPLELLFGMTGGESGPLAGLLGRLREVAATGGCSDPNCTICGPKKAKKARVVGRKKPAGRLAPPTTRKRKVAGK
jgi:hypothetical protein